MYRPTQRTYKNIANGELFQMYSNDTTGNKYLMNDKGIKPTNVFLCAFTPLTVKTTQRTIKLNPNEFVILNNGEVATHRKFCCKKRFQKLT